MGFESQHPLTLEEEREHFRYFALQPIFSPALEVVSYEALYRAGIQDSFSGDGDAASRFMIDNQFLFGYEEVVHKTPIFLNCTRDTLKSELLPMLPEWIGIEILESVELDNEMIELCYELKRLGHCISLDDFDESSHLSDRVNDVLELADWVKIDWQRSPGGIGPLLLNHAHRDRIRVVAEKIESEAEFRRALSLGFDLFQGRCLRPPITYARRVSSVGADRLRVLFDHLDLDLFSDQELVEAICCAPLLEHRVMRRTSWLANRTTPVSSLHAAIELLGRSELRRLIALSLSCGGGPPRMHREVPGADGAS